MKIIEGKGDNFSSYHVLELSDKDIEMIEVVFPPPFGDFNKYKETEWLTRETAKEMSKFIKKNKNKKEVKVEPDFLSKLTLGFKTSCEIIDPIEIQAISIYSWTEVMELYERMYKAMWHKPI